MRAVDSRTPLSSSSFPPLFHGFLFFLPWRQRLSLSLFLFFFFSFLLLSLFLFFPFFLPLSPPRVVSLFVVLLLMMFHSGPFRFSLLLLMCQCSHFLPVLPFSCRRLPHLSFFPLPPVCPPQFCFLQSMF